MMDANVVNNIYETTIANVYMTGHTNTATNYEFISDKKILLLLIESPNYF